MEDDYKLYGSDEGVIDEVTDSEDDEFDDSVGYSSSDESKILYTLSPLTDEEIIKLAESKEVRNDEDVDLSLGVVRGKSGGLYDPAIFGRKRSCICGSVKITKDGKRTVCPNCHTIVFPTDEEFQKNIAYYRLKIPVVYPYKIARLFSELSSYGIGPYKDNKMKLKSNSWKVKLIMLWNTAWTIVPYEEGKPKLTKGNEVYSLDIKEVDDRTPKDEIGLIGLYCLQDYEVNGRKFDLSKYLNTCIPITSTAFRPYSVTKVNGKKRMEIDKRTILYKAIIAMNMNLANTVNLVLDSSIDAAAVFHNLNMLVAIDMFSSDLLKSGKEHTIRDNTRQRVKRSARANIFPALDLDMNHVYVPRSLAYECLNGDIVDKLAEVYDRADAKKMYQRQDPKAIQAFQEIVDSSITVLLRQPVLHKFSMVALYPVLTDEPGIGIPIEICTPLNADFDGDQVPIFFVTDPDMVAELANNMTPHNIWFYEKNQEPIFTPTHEILHGLYLATNMGQVKNPDKLPEYPTFESLESAWDKGFIEYNQIVKCDDKVTTYARSKVEHILGRDLSSALDNPAKGEVNVPVSSRNIGKIIAGLAHDRNRAQIVHELTNFAAEIVTHQGFSTPPFDKVYNPDDPKIQEIINSNDSAEGKYKRLNDYIHDTVVNTIKNLPDSNIGDMLASGGRIKKDQFIDIYAPPIYGGEEVGVSDFNMFQGLAERDFVSASLTNRRVQQIKGASTPISGFLNRQMVLSQLDLRFIDKEESPDQVGLVIPKKYAIGRTMMNGNKIRSAGIGTERVRVKSCINHLDDNFIYADEIDQEHLQEKDNSAIGIAFATSFMEAKTQSALALKHVTVLRKFEDEKIVAIHGGTIVELSDFLVINTNDGGEDRYLLSGNIALVGGITLGSTVKAGQTLVMSKRFQEVYYKLADLSDFLGLQSANTDYVREKGRGKIVCLAPQSGTILYPTKNSISIDGLMIPVNPAEIYYYPAGYKIKKGERFCSGLLDLEAFNNLNNDIQDSFDAMVHQFSDLFGEGTRYELYESIFKSLYHSQFKAQRKYKKTDNFLNRMFYGDTKQALSGFFKEAPEGKIGIEDSIILPLVLGLRPEK